MSDIFTKIEFLRQLMHQIAEEKGIAHPEVLQISQELDVVLNECYKTFYLD